MTKADLKTSSDRVVADLRKLAELTSTPEGAQRLAWGPIWRQARDWYLGLVADIGLTHTRDSAGNIWVTLEGESSDSVLIGSHLDSVPNGGWLDGCLGVLVGLEALRRYQAEGKKPPVTIKVVDWADEEGARFGRSLLGSSAAAGTLKIAEVEHLTDRQGTKLPDAFRENGVELTNVLKANDELKAQNGKAYLELHIEQGPVLESLQKSTGAVIGTFGVERHMMRFTGQAAHSGSTPIPLRKDAFLAAAQTALAIREIGLKHSKPDANVVCTCGVVKVEPCIVTAVPGSCELSLDMRAMHADVLASMYAEAKQAAAKAAADNGVTVEWSLLWEIEPRPFDSQLVQLCEDAIREVTNDCHRLPSGPLHDAAEMVPYMPTVMMFSYSARGLSHCKEEDTPAEHLEKTIQAFMRLVDKTVAWCAKG